MSFTVRLITESGVTEQRNVNSIEDNGTSVMIWFRSDSFSMFHHDNIRHIRRVLDQGSMMTMHSSSELLSLAFAWHTQRFPGSDTREITMKLMEEVGEFSAAVNYALAPERFPGKEDTDAVKEAGDIIVCLLVIMSRWFDNADPLDAAYEKLKLLLTPGAHKASLQ